MWDSLPPVVATATTNASLTGVSVATNTSGMMMMEISSLAASPAPGSTPSSTPNPGIPTAHARHQPPPLPPMTTVECSPSATSHSTTTPSSGTSAHSAVTTGCVNPFATGRETSYSYAQSNLGSSVRSQSSCTHQPAESSISISAAAARSSPTRGIDRHSCHVDERVTSCASSAPLSAALPQPPLMSSVATPARVQGSPAPTAVAFMPLSLGTAATIVAAPHGRGGGASCTSYLPSTPHSFSPPTQGIGALNTRYRGAVTTTLSTFQLSPRSVSPRFRHERVVSASSNGTADATITSTSLIGGAGATWQSPGSISLGSARLAAESASRLGMSAASDPDARYPTSTPGVGAGAAGGTVARPTAGRVNRAGMPPHSPLTSANLTGHAQAASFTMPMSSPAANSTTTITTPPLLRHMARPPNAAAASGTGSGATAGIRQRDGQGNWFEVPSIAHPYNSNEGTSGKLESSSTTTTGAPAASAEMNSSGHSRPVLAGEPFAGGTSSHTRPLIGASSSIAAAGDIPTPLPRTRSFANTIESGTSSTGRNPSSPVTTTTTASVMTRGSPGSPDYLPEWGIEGTCTPPLEAPAPLMVKVLSIVTPTSNTTAKAPVAPLPATCASMVAPFGASASTSNSFTAPSNSTSIGSSGRGNGSASHPPATSAMMGGQAGGDAASPSLPAPPLPGTPVPISCSRTHERVQAQREAALALSARGGGRHHLCSGGGESAVSHRTPEAVQAPPFRSFPVSTPPAAQPSFDTASSYPRSNSEPERPSGVGSHQHSSDHGRHSGPPASQLSMTSPHGFTPSRVPVAESSEIFHSSLLSNSVDHNQSFYMGTTGNDNLRRSFFFPLSARAALMDAVLADGEEGQHRNASVTTAVNSPGRWSPTAGGSGGGRSGSGAAADATATRSDPSGSVAPNMTSYVHPPRPSSTPRRTAGELRGTTSPAPLNANTTATSAAAGEAGFRPLRAHPPPPAPSASASAASPASPGYASGISGNDAYGSPILYRVPSYEGIPFSQASPSNSASHAAMSATVAAAAPVTRSAVSGTALPPLQASTTAMPPSRFLPALANNSISAGAPPHTATTLRQERGGEDAVQSRPSPQPLALPTVSNAPFSPLAKSLSQQNTMTSLDASERRNSSVRGANLSFISPTLASSQMRRRFEESLMRSTSEASFAVPNAVTTATTVPAPVAVPGPVQPGKSKGEGLASSKAVVEQVPAYVQEWEQSLSAFQSRAESYYAFKDVCTETYLTLIEHDVDRFLVCFYNGGGVRPAEAVQQVLLSRNGTTSAVDNGGGAGAATARAPSAPSSSGASGGFQKMLQGNRTLQRLSETGSKWFSSLKRTATQANAPSTTLPATTSIPRSAPSPPTAANTGAARAISISPGPSCDTTASSFVQVRDTLTSGSVSSGCSQSPGDALAATRAEYLLPSPDPESHGGMGKAYGPPMLLHDGENHSASSSSAGPCSDLPSPLDTNPMQPVPYSIYPAPLPAPVVPSSAAVEEMEWRCLRQFGAYQANVIPETFMDVQPNAQVLDHVRRNHIILRHALQHVFSTTSSSGCTTAETSSAAAVKNVPGVTAAPLIDARITQDIHSGLLMPSIQATWRDYLTPLELKVCELVQIAQDNIDPIFVELQAVAGGGSSGSAACQRLADARETPVRRLVRLLRGDAEYLTTIHTMDEEFVENAEAWQERSAAMRGAGVALSDYVPVYGLILSRLHRLEMEHRTALELYGGGAATS